MGGGLAMLDTVATPFGGHVGYLGTHVPDLVAILPPPPAPASPQAAADDAFFLNTRALAGTPRWTVAIADIQTSGYGRFACATGMDLRPGMVPALDRLTARMAMDALVMGLAKKRFAPRPRPFKAHPGAPVCDHVTSDLDTTYDYPSGHATRGYATALVLAELMPDRADALLARGRDYAESRAICGAHTQGAVRAGMLAGAALVAAERGDPGFRNDLQAARVQLSALRRPSSTPPACPAA
jgi:membrane-associated phospholipid phosphatase